MITKGSKEKGPQEAPCTPPEFGWPSATPGGAPGYDDDKEFGNFITHIGARTSQRLREHTARSPEVKGKRRRTRRIWSLAGLRPLGERVFQACVPRMLRSAIS